MSVVTPCFLLSSFFFFSGFISGQRRNTGLHESRSNAVVVGEEVERRRELIVRKDTINGFKNQYDRKKNLQPTGHWSGRSTADSVGDPRIAVKMNGLLMGLCYNVNICSPSGQISSIYLSITH